MHLSDRKEKLYHWFSWQWSNFLKHHS